MKVYPILAGSLTNSVCLSQYLTSPLIRFSDRKSSALDSNSKVVKTHGKSILAESQNLAARLETFVQTSNQRSKKIRQDTEQWQVREQEQLSEQSATAQEQVTKINASLQVIRRQEAISDDSVKALEQAVKDAVAKIETGYKDWAEKLKASCQKICSQAEASSTSSSAAVRVRSVTVSAAAANCLLLGREGVQIRRLAS